MPGTDTIHSLIIPSGAAGRLDRYLAGALALSRTRVQELIRAGRVLVNGQVARPHRPVAAGEVVTVEMPAPPSSPLEPADLPLTIVYEDDHLLVVDKSPGLVVHPAGGTRGPTLVNALLGHGLRLAPGSDPLRPGIVHRLDKDTSGLLLVAKGEEILTLLGEALRQRAIRRRYRALAWGHLPETEGTIAAPIGRHPVHRDRMSTVSRRARPAVTHFRLLERFTVCDHLEISLESGRTHQVRVHLASRGHPLVGDGTYGGGSGRERGFMGPQRETARRLLTILPRQALHAWCLDLAHPVTGAPLHFEAPLPEDMAGALAYLRGEREGGGRA